MTPRRLALLSTLAAAGVLLALALREAWISDDALITFRYVQNLAAGHGLVFNLGERVEGFSNPLFTLLLTPFALAGANLFVVAQAIGVVATLAELGLLAWLTFRVTASAAATALAASLFATDRIVSVWATGGLETASHALLVFAVFAVVVSTRAEPARSARPATILLVLLAASRPEGIVFYPLYVGWLTLRRAWPALRRSLNLYVPAVAVLLCARLAYYGELLPNPFRAKLGGVPEVALFGGGYLLAFARRAGWTGLYALPWLLLLALCATTPRSDSRTELRRALTVAVAVAGIILAMAGGMGGDYMCDFRFLRPLMGVLCFAVAVALAIAAGAGGGRRFGAIAVGVALFATHLVRQQQASPVFADAPNAREHKPLIAATALTAARFRAALVGFSEPGDVQLSDKAGVMGYGHVLRTVDATGLVSRRIEADFYLRDAFGENGVRERVPGHARWPRVDFLERDRFTFIFPKVNDLPPQVPEIRPGMPRRTRDYPFLHVTVPLPTGEFFRFFTTLTEEQVFARARRRHLGVCVRRPWAELRCVPPNP